MIQYTKTEFIWADYSNSNYVCPKQNRKDGHQILSGWRFPSTFSYVHFLNFLQVLCIILLTRESHNRFVLFCFLTRIWQQIKWATPGAQITSLARRRENGGGWRVMPFETHRNWGQRRWDRGRANGRLPCNSEVPMVLLLQATPSTMLSRKNPTKPQSKQGSRY